MKFKLHSEFSPTGDQPQAIKQLVQGIKDGDKAQVLLGVTGSGKTFTIANVIAQAGKPTIIMSHNKTLAAQLYGEFKRFFPENAVEYYVSYYDYYQPEAYIPQTNTYIEKDLAINDDLDKLRLSAASSLLSGRKDVIVIASVSCIYGIGNPTDFEAGTIHLRVGQKVDMNAFLLTLVDSLYSRNEMEFNRGKFRIKGDTVDIHPAYADYAYRVVFFDDEIEELGKFDPLTNKTIESMSEMVLYPAGNFLTNRNTLATALKEIQSDMFESCDEFKKNGQILEAKRLEERVNNDMEMLQELGYCSGIENYSRYFDRRKPGDRPFCLLDYFPDDYLMIIDESHVTVPQLHAMYGGDRSRKQNLVQYGFRLPAAFDNRPLRFEEFKMLQPQTIYMSATPSPYEINEADGIIIEQLIRPTGLLDPPIEVHPAKNQVDDLLEEISKVVDKGERVLVTTLTKRMAEELTQYLTKLDIRTKYIHSDIDTLERVEIMNDLRAGSFDVLVGVNLLREGLDLPEVALVAILDADKEGFLRNDKSLIQTIGRAARNVNSKAILYGDKITDSMQRTIDMNLHNREKQIAYNKEHNITPRQVKREIDTVLPQSEKKTEEQSHKTEQKKAKKEIEKIVISQKENGKMTQTKEALIKQLEKKMNDAVKTLDFLQAAVYRDEIKRLKSE
ncbi:MAG: excinuclease ABC subunit UvrB [Bacteroidales bacterium]|nr:excinuclease ABC subunit UvrB [Bacteroidales bacterium]